MRLKDLFPPRWQSRYPKVRLQAVARLHDQEALKEVVLAGRFEDARDAALARIHDEQTLESLLSVLARQYTTSLPLAERERRTKAILDRIHSSKILINAALLGFNQALEQPHDDADLFRVYSLGPRSCVGTQAIDRIRRIDLLLQALHDLVDTKSNYSEAEQREQSLRHIRGRIAARLEEARSAGEWPVVACALKFDDYWPLQIAARIELAMQVPPDAVDAETIAALGNAFQTDLPALSPFLDQLAAGGWKIEKHVFDKECPACKGQGGEFLLAPVWEDEPSRKWFPCERCAGGKQVQEARVTCSKNGEEVVLELKP
jgi:hypothetical protein